MVREALVPTRKEIAKAMSRKPVYKVVREEGGQLKSLWVQGTESEPCVCYNRLEEEFTGITLTYARGKLTSNGRYGIFCCKTLEGARKQIGGNGQRKMCLVFKAYHLGRRIHNDSSYGTLDTILYPAIILGKRVIEVVDNSGRY